MKLHTLIILATLGIIIFLLLDPSVLDRIPSFQKVNQTREETLRTEVMDIFFNMAPLLFIFVATFIIFSVIRGIFSDGGLPYVSYNSDIQYEKESERDYWPCKYCLNHNEIKDRECSKCGSPRDLRYRK